MKRILSIFAVSMILMACSQPSAPDGKEGKTGTGIGDRAPEIVLHSPGGEKIALTSLRGKMVLIDFWASWCSPCRIENPNLVKLYREYRDREFKNGSGFTVYGVSLDKSMESWVEAIEKDHLEWESHVSDLQGWQSAAAMNYGVTGIPMNFLIDGDGIIVAMGLRGEYLENKLKELLK